MTKNEKIQILQRIKGRFELFLEEVKSPQTVPSKKLKKIKDEVLELTELLEIVLLSEISEENKAKFKLKEETEDYLEVGYLKSRLRNHLVEELYPTVVSALREEQQVQEQREC